MTYRLRLSLLAVVLFCLTSMAGCPNKEPGGQFTVVQGTVVNVRTKQPLPGVRIVLASDDRGTSSYYTEVDSARTDPQGKYTLSFTNTKGLYYGVSCEGTRINYEGFRLDLPDSLVTSSNPYSLRTLAVTLGRTNTVNFKASPRRVFRVQVATRRTGWQRLRFSSGQTLPADNQTQTVYLYVPVPFYTSDIRFPQFFVNKPSVPPVVTFSRTLPSGATQDTLFQLKTSTPLTGDTVQASLQFGR